MFGSLVLVELQLYSRIWISNNVVNQVRVVGKIIIPIIIHMGDKVVLIQSI